MPQQDAMKLKEQILQILRRRGPSLPVHISKETGLTILFSSAFLAELLSEKIIKITDMKVGGSPVYYLPGHEYLLERFSQHLKSKEKDAYNILKEKNFLLDEEQEPAIRVALRSLKDFAFPFKHKEKVYWRYFRIPESDFKPENKIEEPAVKEKTKEEEPKKIEVQISKPAVEEKAPVLVAIVEEKKSEQIEPIKEKTQEKEPEKTEKREPKKPRTVKKSIKKKSTPPNENKFFLKIKEFLVEKEIEIIDLVDINKTNLILKIKDKKEEKLVIAYNKKKINETDIISAHKKAVVFNMPYIILTAGDSSKKIKELIEAIRDLEYLEKVG